MEKDTVIGPYRVERLWKGYYVVRHDSTQEILGRCRFQSDEGEGHWKFRKESDPEGNWSGASELVSVLALLLPEEEKVKEKAAAVVEAILRMEIAHF